MNNNNYNQHGMFRRESKFVNMLDKVRMSSREFVVPKDAKGAAEIKAEALITATAERMAEADTAQGGHTCRDTGMLVGKGYEERLHYEVRRSRRYKYPVSLCIFDIDQLDAVDQRLGASARKYLINSIASRILSSLRDADLCARVGENTFAVIFPHTPLDGSYIAGERVCKAISSRPHTYLGEELRVTVSSGCAEMNGSGNVTALEGMARQAASQSKERGGNQVTRCRSHSDAVTPEPATVETEEFSGVVS